MSGYYYLYYVQTNLFCMVILGFILWAYIRDGHKKAESVYYKAAIIELMIYCLSDIVAAAFKGNPSHNARIILFIANSLYVSMSLIIAFTWELYAKNRMAEYGFKDNNLSTFLRIAVLVTFAVSLSTPFTEFAFYLDAQNVYHRNTGSYIIPIMCYLELFTVSIRFLVWRTKCDSKEGYMYASSMARFWIMPFVCSIIQMLVYGCTIIQVGFTISYLFVTINRLRSLLYRK